MGIVDLLYPKNCLGCDKQGSYVCSSCVDKVQTPSQVCAECGRPAIDGITHVRCKRPLGLDGLSIFWPYKGVIRKAILALKYKYARQISKELAQYLFIYLKRRKIVLPKESVLVTIPLYWYRENWRGFNQTEEIGKLLANKMGWDFRPDILVRKRLKKPQAKLQKKERNQNIRGVFAINPNCRLQDTSYILFDDVYTTGATLKEAARVLKRNGAKKVWGLAVAR